MNACQKNPQEELDCELTPEHSECQDTDPDPVDEFDPRSLVTEECAHLENIGDWQPVWCDEFDQDGLPNPLKWGYDVGGHGWGNNELQFYTRENLNNVFIEDGTLHIQAVKETIGSRNYSSARLTTEFTGSWLYGRIQVSARMPSGRGLWPAIWMLPTERVFGEWPASGEIDIMEYVGYNPGVVHGTIHTSAYNHMLNTDISFTKVVPTVEDEFHLYEMIWEPGSIELFIDGERFAIFGFNPDSPRNIGIETYEAWPFDQAFHLILNVAVGGDWGGREGVDDSIFPQAMEIEFVRVYQKDYAGLTENPPGTPGGITVQSVNHNSARFRFSPSVAEVMVSHYNVYINGVYDGKTTVNAYTVRNLTPNESHIIEVYAVDFKGQTSESVLTLITTEDVRVITERIEAEEYDNMRGIRTVSTNDVGGGRHVTSINNTNYIEFDLRVEKSALYTAHYRVAAQAGGGEIVLFIDGVNTGHITTLSSTGGDHIWETVMSEPIALDEGIYTFRLFARRGGFNINYFEFHEVKENGND